MISAYSGFESLNSNEKALEVRNISVGFGDKTILDQVSFSLERGEIFSLIGASGTGKSVLMQAILGLIPLRSGHLSLMGQAIDSLSSHDSFLVRKRIGVLFQHGALFSSQTVLENIMTPMREVGLVPDSVQEKIARMKLDMVGLAQKTAGLYPSEISGGMMKRLAIARALALDPQLLFLDEPCAGLDPIGVTEIDKLILYLRGALNLTVMMVTHDLVSLRRLSDRVLVLGGTGVIACGDYDDITASTHPWINAYFSSGNLDFDV